MYKIKVETEQRGDVIIIRLSGEFNISNLKEVESAWNEQLTKNPKIIAINCENLNYIDSSAIGTLVKFLNAAMNKNIQLIFYELSNSIQQMFATSRLNRFFKITTKAKFEAEHLSD